MCRTRDFRDLSRGGCYQNCVCLGGVRKDHNPMNRTEVHHAMLPTRIRLTPWLQLAIIVGCLALYHIAEGKRLAWLELLGSVALALSQIRKQTHR